MARGSYNDPTDVPYKGEFIEPEVPRKTPAKKDTKTWCKGKVGREHVREVQFRSQYNRACQWYPWWVHGLQDPASWRWSCYHATVCSTCGKVLVDSLEKDCPEITPEPTEPRYHPRYQ